MRILVTGAASGIGLATAVRLANDVPRWSGNKARLVLVDRDAASLEAVAAELTNAEVFSVVGDLADPLECERAVAAAQETFGGLEALVSNAGIVRHASLLELSIEEYEQTFAINTRATWLLAKAAHSMLKSSRGAIVATASVAAHEPAISLGAYSASKAALLMLMQQLACDWGRDGIRCNTISPGSTKTNITQRSRENAGSAGRGNNPLGIVSDPADQAAAIAFLLSPDARFINGSDLGVDGGARTQLMLKAGMARAD